MSEIITTYEVRDPKIPIPMKRDGYRSVSSWYFLNNSGKSACFLIVICREYL
ncbi:MAG: hypothetical protein WCX97_00740 [Candidatus Magasanikbacteria bacterium]